MKYIIHNKKEDIQVITEKYPRADISEPLEGVNDIQIYVIIDKKPNYNPDKSCLKIGKIELTTKVFEKYNHLLIANQLYDIVDFPKETVIDSLNESLGSHLDEQYPLWVRSKHAGEGTIILQAQLDGVATPEQLIRKTFLISMYDWATKCRVDRDIREKEYKDNDIFPSFKWDNKPT